MLLQYYILRNKRNLHIAVAGGGQRGGRVLAAHLLQARLCRDLSLEELLQAAGKKHLRVTLTEIFHSYVSSVDRMRLPSNSSNAV